MVAKFTKRYRVDRPVYYEVHCNADSAIAREKQIKKGRRVLMIRLIEKGNRDWEDLSDDIAR